MIHAGFTPALHIPLAAYTSGRDVQQPRVVAEHKLEALQLHQRALPYQGGCCSAKWAVRGWASAEWVCEWWVGAWVGGFLGVASLLLL